MCVCFCLSLHVYVHQFCANPSLAEVKIFWFLSSTQYMRASLASLALQSYYSTWPLSVFTTDMKPYFQMKFKIEENTEYGSCG